MSQADSRPVTSADVAREAGVSRTTVSIVLRGHTASKKIGADTIRRVVAAAEKLKYVPNLMARSLRQQKSGSIGVVIGNFRSDWADSLMAGMQEVFEPSGYTPFFSAHRFDARRAHNELLACLRRRDEGVVYQPMPGETRFYNRLRDADAPLLYLADRPPNTPQASFVGWDSVTATRVAIRHLVETGRNRIAMVGLDYPMEMNRGCQKVFIDVLKETGLPLQDRWIALAPPSWTLERIMNWALDRFMPPGREYPDAVFALGDTLALALLEILDVRGIRVPEDVAVMGLGDLPLTGHTRIGLSTVREPTREIGRQAAKLMLELINEPPQAPSQRLIGGIELKARRTTLPANTCSTGRRWSDWANTSPMAG